MKFKIILYQLLKNNKLTFNLLCYYLKRTLPLLYYPFTKTKKLNKIIFFVGNQGDGLSFVTRIIRRNNEIISISGNNKYWSGPDEMATVMEYVLPYNFRLPGILTREKLKTNLGQVLRDLRLLLDNLLFHFRLGVSPWPRPGL